MPIALHSGWMHREVSRSGFRKMKKRFFVLIAEDGSNDIRVPAGAEIGTNGVTATRAPSEPEPEPRQAQQAEQWIATAGRERLLIHFEDSSATLGCRVRRVILLRPGCFTISRTKNSRRGFPHCMRLDVEVEDNDQTADASEAADYGSATMLSDSELASSACLVAEGEDIAESSQTLANSIAVDGGNKSSLVPGGESENSLPLTSGDSKTKHVFALSTREELDAWMAVLRESGAQEAPRSIDDAKDEEAEDEEVVNEMTEFHDSAVVADNRMQEQ